MSRTFLVIAGPTNAGKTTLLHLLQAAGHAGTSFDEVRAGLRRERRAVPRRSRVAADAAALERALAAWRDGRSVALEGVPYLLPGPLRRALARLAAEAAPAAVVLLDPPFATLRARLARRVHGRRQGLRRLLERWLLLVLSFTLGRALLPRTRARLAAAGVPVLHLRRPDLAPEAIAALVARFAAGGGAAPAARRDAVAAP